MAYSDQIGNPASK